MSTDRVAIVTTAHWEGDARLRRHVHYMSRAGISATVVSFADRGRMGAVIGALVEIVRTDANVILLPDPEMLAIGSLVARFARKKSIIDIHEDYAKAAAGRTWVPRSSRGLVQVLAGLGIWLGRVLANEIVVAAPELSRSGDLVVRNLPEPASLPNSGGSTKSQVVYVGDVTLARGAAEMIEVLAQLPDSIRLLMIGRVTPEAEKAIAGRTDGENLRSRLVLAGRMEHEIAWREASGSVAGLCLLQPLPAYQEAIATKIWEYMAAGIPPVVSDLPGQRSLVGRIHPDLVCRSPEEAALIVARLATEPLFRSELADRGRDIYQAAWDDFRPDLVLQVAVAP